MQLSIFEEQQKSGYSTPETSINSTDSYNAGIANNKPLA